MYFSDQNLIFFLCNLLALLVAIGTGIKAKRNGLIGYSIFFPIIIIFALNEGLRWGRGTDYNVYYYVYNSILSNSSIIEHEPLFNLLVNACGLLDLAWQDFVFLTSLFLIISGCIFFYPYKKYIIFLLPIFLLRVPPVSENLIRWHLGFSFMLIGLFFLQKRKIGVSIAFAVCAFLVHYGLIVNIIGFYVIYLFKKPLFKPSYSIIIYFLLYLFFDREFMSQFSATLQNLNLGERFVYYQSNAEAWLTGTYHDNDGFSVGFTDIITSVFFIVFGYALLKKYSNLTFFYNVGLIGCLTCPAMIQIELAWRINILYYLFTFLFLAFIFYDVLVRNKQRNMVYFITLIICLNLLRAYLMYPFTIEPSATLYIWDAHGRSVLPI